jgi:hypothetical protein
MSLAKLVKRFEDRKLSRTPLALSESCRTLIFVQSLSYDRNPKYLVIKKMENSI